MPCNRSIVEAAYRQIAWHLDSSFAGDADHRRRHVIVGGEDSGWWLVKIKQLVGSTNTRFKRKLPLRHQGFVIGNTCLIQGLAIARETPLAGTVRTWTLDVGNTAMTLCNQALHQLR